MLQGLQRGAGATRASVWQLWERWISEIVADFWSVARVGIASTLGLMGVVSLPRAFVFRLNVDDPHPMPWIRVKLSGAMGEALYPHPQWRRLSATWESFYPPSGAGRSRRRTLLARAAGEHAGVRRAARQSPAQGAARSLADGGAGGRTAAAGAALRALSAVERDAVRRCTARRRSLVFAVLGQARADGQLTPEDESALFGKLLTHWALRGTLNMSEICAAAPAAVAARRMRKLKRRMQMAEPTRQDRRLRHRRGARELRPRRPRQTRARRQDHNPRRRCRVNIHQSGYKDRAPTPFRTVLTDAKRLLFHQIFRQAI